MRAAVEKKTRKSEAKRRERNILTAALAIFSRKGFAAATIPEIANAAGVAVGTIYVYYPNKRALFVAVIRDHLLNTSLLDLVKKVPSGDIENILTEIMKNRLDLLEERGSGIFSLIGEIMRDPELREAWRKEIIGPFLTMLEGILTSMSSDSRFRRLEPAVLTRAIGGMVIGFLLLRKIEGRDGSLNRLPPETIATGLRDFILHGIMAEPSCNVSG